MEHIIWLHHRMHRSQLPCSTTTTIPWTKIETTRANIIPRANTESIDLLCIEMSLETINEATEWNEKEKNAPKLQIKIGDYFFGVCVCATQNVMQIVFTMIFPRQFSLSKCLFNSFCSYDCGDSLMGIHNRDVTGLSLQIKRVLLRCLQRIWNSV